MEQFSLLRDFALIMVIAGIVTLVLRKLHQPPVLGYLVAGLILSPYFVPFYSVTDINTVRMLAEIGLILLLYGVGLEFGWSKIRQIGVVALLIGGIEIATMISLGYGLGRLLGWSSTDALFLGAALHTSSSAIIVKILKDLGKMNFVSSRVIVGILVVEDFAAVIVIAVLSGINTPGIASFGNIPSLALRLVIFVASSLALGAIIVPRIINLVRRFQSKETLLIVSLGISFGMAFLSKELGLSVATGAFLIGALIGDTEHSEEVVGVMAPVRDMFAALFFVSIGMLIDLSKFRDFLLPAVIVAGVFIVGKILANTIAAIISGYKARDSFRVGMSMPQMGEFSLAIAKVGVDSNVLVAPLYPVIAVATTLTSVIAPFLTRSSDTVADFLDRKSPRLLREYVNHLNDWGQTVRRLFPSQGEEAIRIRQSIRTILLNFLILLVVIGIGTFALQNLPILSEYTPVRRDIVALLLGSAILFLCVPSLILIWRNLNYIINEITRQILDYSVTARIWKGEVIRKVLLDSTAIILSILMLLWLIPFISQLLFIGSLALAIPALLLAFILYLVLRSIRGVHRQLQKTFSQVFLGELPTFANDEITFSGTRPKFIRKVMHRRSHGLKQPVETELTIESDADKEKTASPDKQ